MQDRDLKRDIEQLYARLERVERLLHIAPGTTPIGDDSRIKTAPELAPPPVAPAVAKTAEPETPQVHDAGLRQRTATARPPDIQPPPPRVPFSEETQLGALAHPPTSGLPSAKHRKWEPSPGPQKQDASLEMVIGSKWLAWVGAIVVLLAMVFLIMVGVKRGWWGRLPAEVRCLSIAGFGALLLIGGEIALRRIGKAASAGLFSAGLGTLYLDSFATYQPFNLVSELGAFPLLAGVALIGFFITVRTGFLSIGVLSVIGGYLAPLLLWERTSETVWLPMYLTMLLTIALGLSATHPNDFRPLRYVALAIQLFVGLVWIVGVGPVVWKSAMVFMTIWTALLLFEVIVAALREQSAIGNVVAAVVGTAGFVSAGCWLLKQFQPVGFNWMGAFTLAVGVLNAAAAAQFGPGLDGLRGRLRNAMDKLAAALWLQAGALLAAAIALHFDDVGQSIAWLAVGLASIEIGRRLPSRGVTIFGLTIGALAVLRVAFLDHWIAAGISQPLWKLGSVTITKWSVLAMVTIVVIHLAAHRLHGAWLRMPIALAIIATAFWLILCGAQCQGLSVTFGWLIGAAVLLALERVSRRQRYWEIALIVLALTAGRWLFIDALTQRVRPNWQGGSALPVMNWQMALAVGIAVVGWWAMRILAIRERLKFGPDTSAAASRFFQVGASVGAVFGLFALSFEVDRTLAQMRDRPGWLAHWSRDQSLALWLTMLWSAGGMAIHEIGRRVRINSLIATGWWTCAAAAVFWLTYDTISWRFMDGVVRAPAILNLQFVAGALAASTLLITTWRWHTQIQADRHSHVESHTDTAYLIAPIGLTLVAAIGLWLGSLEIDRFFADEPMQRQTGLSIYWGLYAVMLIVTGFIGRAPSARYAGLGLLLITLGKAFFIDMRHVDLLWRAVIFGVVGLLFIGTSMLYIKLAPSVERRS